MEISFKTISLLVSIILTGLSAGLFYAWEVSVIPGTKRIGNEAYIETMQSINKAIINPAFMLIFIGSLVMQGLSAYQFRGTQVFWFVLGALIIYALGTFSVTGMGNVPLNNTLETINANGLSSNELATTRSDYEQPWNRLNRIRTVFAVLSFVLLQLAVFLPVKQ
ncbi:MAG: anthrone oxygenase family protein [Bacteroidota bacterium]